MTNQTTAKYNINDVDDLTHFANESFDTDEVDLFQFSGDESSPLTKLKSVILSLDWDITDEYLQELADELAYLAPSWQDDKVASLYLQGMGKIGKYLRLRGAHAHANSIKLLLTYFSHFETILASPDMSGESITTLVQNDVRKFKVLQYQIKLKEDGAVEEQAGAPAGKGLSTARETGEAENALRNFKAAILELDWEVSDNSLAKFAASLQALGEEKIQNKSALILIQGMQALGQYISDERSNANPEVFNLLHAFHDGLEQILDEVPSAPDRQKIKNILVDRVNRLNNLKKLIAPKESVIPETVPIPQPALRPEPAGAAALEDAGKAVPQETVTADSQPSEPAVHVDEALEAPALPVEEAIEPALSVEENLAISHQERTFDTDENLPDEPEIALLDETETAGTSLAEDFPIELDMDDKQPADASTGIESEIDALFAGSSKRAMLSSEEEYPVEELPATAYTAVDDEVSDGFIDDNVGVRGGITPALAGIAEESGFGDEEEEFDPETRSEIDEQFDFFFGESEASAEQSEPAASLFDEEFEEPVESLDPLTGTASSDGENLLAESGESTVFSEALEIEELLSGGKQSQSLQAPVALEGEDKEEEFPSDGIADAVPAALADAAVPEQAADFATVEADEEITNKLDSFFDQPDTDNEAEQQPSTATARDNLFEEPALASTPELAGMALSDTEEQDPLTDARQLDAMPAALTDAEPPAVENALAEEEPDKEITGKLDAFFDLESEEEIEPPLFQPEPPLTEQNISAVAAEQPEEAENLLEPGRLDDDIPAALLNAVVPEDSASALVEDEAGLTKDVELEDQLDAFFDAPNKDLEPTEEEFAQLAVLPEQDTDDDVDEDIPESETDLYLSQGALADVVAPSYKTSSAGNLDLGIEQFLDSFLEDKPEASPPAQDEMPPEVAEWDVFAGEKEDTEEEPSLFAEAAPPEVEPLQSETVAAVLFEEESTEPVFAEPADTDHLASPETTEDLTALFAEDTATDSGEDVPAETAVQGDEEESVFQTAQETTASADSLDVNNQELQLEKTPAVSAGSSDDFEDILDSSEVQEFLLSGQDIEDIPDEELEFADEELLEASEEESALEESVSSLEASQDEDLFADTASAENSASIMDDPADTAPFATGATGNEEEESAAIEDLFLAGEEQEHVLNTSDTLTETAEDETDLSASPVEETKEFAAASNALADAMTALSAVLPALLTNPTAEHLADSRQHLLSLQTSAELNPVQRTAATMLDTVLAGLPRHAGDENSSLAVVEGLYQALAEPREQLPLETVTAYSQWMQALLSKNLIAESGAQSSQEYFTARDLYQELSGFRARMEEELGEIRKAIQNK